MRFHLFEDPPEDAGAYRATLILAGWNPLCPYCKTQLRLQRSLFDFSTQQLKVWSLCQMGHTNVQTLEKT